MRKLYIALAAAILTANAMAQTAETEKPEAKEPVAKNESKTKKVINEIKNIDKNAFISNFEYDKIENILEYPEYWYKLIVKVNKNNKIAFTKNICIKIKK